MIALVAAAAHPIPTPRLILAAIGAVLIMTGWYAIACTFWPFARCWRCKGDGKRHQPNRKAFGHCRWCKGTGRRRRFGRMVYAYFRHTRDRALP